jgi:Zn-dependent peptidase ImmA (M78 family)
VLSGQTGVHHAPVPTGGFHRSATPSAIIGLNRRHSPGRRHFSFWHEVGHYVLHRRAALHGPLACLQAKGETAFPSMEREADRFAASVLMPEDWVRRAHAEGGSPERLAKQFAVTRQAMTRRLAELHLR